MAEKIINNTKDFYRGRTKQYIRVESSKSVSYRHKLADEWQSRIWQHYLDYKKAGGQVIFATFTYNDFMRPRYSYTDLEGNKKSFPCFSKRDKDRFLNKLLKRWERVGLTGKTTSLPFSYVWANEYGTSTKGQHLAHYHCLFFIPNEIWNYELSQCFTSKVRSMPELHWKNLFRHYWSVRGRSLGMVMWSPGEPILVNSEFACTYCSKYMFKSENLLENPNVKEYLSIYGELPSQGKKKGSFTTHWQSFHLGESLKDVFLDTKNYEEGVNFMLPSEIKKGKIVRHPCPQYIERKIHYDYDRDKNQYKLNELGLNRKFNKFLKKFPNYVERLERYFNDKFIDASITNYDVLQSKVLKKFGSLEALKQWLHNTHSRNFVENSVLYMKVWEGLLMSRDEYDRVFNLPFDKFKEESFKQYKLNLAPHLDAPLGADFHCEEGVFKENYIFKTQLRQDLFGNVVPVHEEFFSASGHEIFFHCHQFLDIVEEIDRIYYDRCEKIYKEDSERRKEIKMACA